MMAGKGHCLVCFVHQPCCTIFSPDGFGEDDVLWPCTGNFVIVCISLLLVWLGEFLLHVINGDSLSETPGKREGGKLEATEKPPGQDKQCREEWGEFYINSPFYGEMKSEQDGRSQSQKMITWFSHIEHTPLFGSLVQVSTKNAHSKIDLATLKSLFLR